MRSYLSVLFETLSVLCLALVFGAVGAAIMVWVMGW